MPHFNDLIRVKSNLGNTLTRQLGKAFSGNAIGTANPNTLRNNLPNVADAMGLAGQTGQVTFAQDGASQTFTIFYWSQIVNNANPAEGWVQLGANSNEYTKSVDPYSAASFSVPENAPIFIMASTSACPNCYMGGAKHHPSNTVADMQGNGI